MTLDCFLEVKNQTFQFATIGGDKRSTSRSGRFPSEKSAFGTY